ncbi:MAG TPA: CocE/NonD family hydrolase [Chloroflexota bacterium]|nr:CocE/NonD family hydrolase [Chloroflexota bacterium]HVC83160.1 CocE/NonD family hydrolase [Chloroflexota bacterium]
MLHRESDITVEFDMPATMRDGTVLRANIYRPRGEGPWPVLLTRLPYGKDLPLGSAVLDPVQVARRGYVVIVQDTRGCWASEGDWYPFVTEAEDGVDTIAWAASLPYADGQVGMYGASYYGFTQWAAAALRPPALRALVPSVTWADPADGLMSRGGAREHGPGARWNMLMGLGELARRHAGDAPALGKAIWMLGQEIDALGSRGYWELPLADFPPLRRTNVGRMFFDSFAAPQDVTPRPVAATAIVGKHAGVQVPTFNIGGWYDIFLAGTIANYTAMRSQGKPAKLLIGPWTHGLGGNPVGEINFGMGAQGSFLDLRTDLGSLQLRWFDHWLKARDTGIMEEPPIKLFVMGANLWRDEQEWPLARAVPSQWYLHTEGTLSRERPDDETPDLYDYDPADPTPTRGGALLMTPEFPPGPYDQRVIEARPDVLVYRSAPLEHDVEVTGPIAVHLWAISSAPDTDFVARLTDIFPDGRAINLTDGIIRARYRNHAKGEAPTLIEPGRPYEYEIDLWATSNLFKAGHRIGLQVTSSNFPRWDRNQNTGHPIGVDAELAVAHQQILHDQEHPSRVVLPLVVGAPAQS